MSIGLWKQFQNQLCNMLETCRMSFHKWNSNSLKLINIKLLEVNEYNFSINEIRTSKTFGVIWKPIEDQFMLKISITAKSSYTKRVVLSTIIKLNDHLSLLKPNFAWLKLFLQKLWLMKLSWEDEIPNPVVSKWSLPLRYHFKT